MKKLLSIKYSATAFNLAILVLRVGAGILIANKGLNKIKNFDHSKEVFMNFMGLGSTVSLCLVIFAEFFCGILIILGLVTRLATIPLLITMSVVVIVNDKWDILGKGGFPALLFFVFFTLLLVGPGKYSVDGAINK